MKVSVYTILAFFVTTILNSCTKYLDKKPDSAIVVPQTLEDLQGLLDDNRYMNGSNQLLSQGGPNPALLETGADNYYIPDLIFQTSASYIKSTYTWSKENTYGAEPYVPDWSTAYRAVFYSNVVLEGLASIARTEVNKEQWNNIRGSALFFRSYAFYQLLQVFAPAFEITSAEQDPGIPLRLVSDINSKTIRQSVGEGYRQILADLREARKLLPLHPLAKTRPSTPAVMAFFARIYLTMNDYDQAIDYADSCLQMSPLLLDYNLLDQQAQYPFALFNEEVLFQSLIQDHPYSQAWAPQSIRVDSNLYNSYDSNDLRKELFFEPADSGTFTFTNSYNGDYFCFFGLASDEIYLISAECLARTGDLDGSMEKLNQLLLTRWKTGTFIPFSAPSREEALKIIIRERRKELVMRGLRFPDLRRLNREPLFAITMTRIIDGQLYTLAPGDPRYTWPIPEDVIQLTGIAQNPR